MRTLALPIRVNPDGQLARADAADSLLDLIATMAATTSGTWLHAPWFGLHELFTRANMSLQDHPGIADAINVALGELAITWATVDSVSTARDRAALGERRFGITLLVKGDKPVFRQFGT